MAAAVEGHWDGRLEGLVVTRYGHGVPCSRIRVVEAGHPVPDAAGPAAAREILSLVSGLTPDDLVLCLISGGGSALLALPADGVTLADKQAINRALLRSGAHIGEMNVVRKHLSAIKGGQLAVAAAPAQVVSLIISDVPRDDLSIIASGPTVADPSTNAQALTILRKYEIEIPAARPESAERSDAGDAQTGRCQAGEGRQSLDRHAANIVGSGGGGRKGGGVRAAHPGQRDRGRSARGRHRPRGHCVAMRAPWSTCGPSLLPDFRRRDHRDGARERPGRPQCRIPAEPDVRARRPSRHRRAGLRHRRDRRQRGQRGRSSAAR